MALELLLRLSDILILLFLSLVLAAALSPPSGHDHPCRRTSTASRRSAGALVSVPFAAMLQVLWGEIVVPWPLDLIDEDDEAEVAPSG